MPRIISTSASAACAALASAALLGGCTVDESPARTAASAQTERQCFLPRQVNGFHALDDDTVHVTVGASQVYELELLGFCPDVDWSTRIGIRSTGGGNWVCQGLDAELIVPGPGGPRTCPVSSVRKLTDEEVRAYRESRRRN